MVCVEGAAAGVDYKVREGRNLVGRGADMDIQILGDSEINNRNHAVIFYDTKKLNTMILPGDATGITYLNEQPVCAPTELKPYDTIGMGNSRFLFVPLCGLNFSWTDVK